MTATRRTDLAIHEHLLVCETDESGAVLFRCDSACDWFLWLAPVPPPSFLPMQSGSVERLSPAVKRSGRAGVARARRALTLASARVS